MGTLSFTGNATYIPYTLPNGTLLIKHSRMANSFGLSVSDANNQLPSIYAIPKLHKNPYKFRMITSATKCTTKPVSLLLLSVLKKFDSHLKNYCNKVSVTAHYNPYWPIDNSLTVIHKFLSQPELQNATHIQSFDFSTLFPSLPHAEIKKALYWLTDFLFKNSGKPYLATSSYYSYYCDSEPKSSQFTLLSPSSVKELINCVVDESYVTFAGHVFQAICGVPQGGNASPLIATLTLTVMELKFYQNSTNRSLIKQSLYFCRYIDDLLCVNCSNFSDIAKQIYPDSLPLTTSSSTSSDSKCDFLDLTLSLSPFSISVYNKTDDFNFDVLRYVHNDSNVASSLGYNVFIAQIIRFSRICTDFSDFKNKSQDLFSIFLTHGFAKSQLICKLVHCFKRHPQILAKFSLHTHNLFHLANRLVK